MEQHAESVCGCGLSFAQWQGTAAAWCGFGVRWGVESVRDRRVTLLCSAHCVSGVRSHALRGGLSTLAPQTASP